MSNLLARSGSLLIALLLSACAATVQQSAPAEGAGVGAGIDAPAAATRRIVFQVEGSPSATGSNDWQTLRAASRSAMAETAAGAGIAFDWQDKAGEPAVAGHATLVVAHVNDYRYLSAGARYGLGAFTGNAFVDAQVRFYELPARKLLASKKYSTSSSAWEGIFSAMTDKQLLAISERIVADVRGR